MTLVENSDMALTADILKANKALATLTDEQLQTIATLSFNDEEAVIGARIGALHGDYDKDVLGVTGIAKKQGEKSYDYVKRVLADYKSTIDSQKTLADQLAAANTAKADLEAKLKDGTGDAHLKQQLTDATAKITQLQAAIDADKAKYTADITKYESDLHSMQVNHELENAIAGMAFKATIPESVKQVLIDNAKNQIHTGTKPEFITDAAGKKQLVFRDATGNVMNNPENKLNPYTAKELLANNLKDVLDLGRQQPGTGTQNPKVLGTSTSVDLSAAKSQVAADEAIQSYLMSTGLTRGSAEFAEKQAAIRTEHGVDKLPIR